jgi:hypothetical protein
VRLLTFEDGLGYRQRVHGTRDDALATYARDGIDLGLPIAD